MLSTYPGKFHLFTNIPLLQKSDHGHDGQNRYWIKIFAVSNFDPACLKKANYLELPCLCPAKVN